MLHFLLAVHFLLTLAIIGLILLQKHDSDGALGSSGGGAASGMFSVRGQANLLTRSTAFLMTIFALNCLVLAKMVKSMPDKRSVIDRVAEAPLPGDGTPMSGFLNKKKTAPVPQKNDVDKSVENSNIDKKAPVKPNTNSKKENLSNVNSGAKKK